MKRSGGGEVIDLTDDDTSSSRNKIARTNSGQRSHSNRSRESQSYNTSSGSQRSNCYGRETGFQNYNRSERGYQESYLSENWLGFQPTRIQQSWALQFRNSEDNYERHQFPDPDIFSHPSQRFRISLNPDPDRFTPVAEELAEPIPRDKIRLGASKWKSLTNTIFDEYRKTQQSLGTMKEKIKLWKEIYGAIMKEFDCGLFVFGSTFNGFGGDDSDIDMCLFPHGAPSFDAKQKLNIVRKILKENCSHVIRTNIELIPAKVPILKFMDRRGNYEIDLSIENPTSIRNTHLLYYYSKLDYRVRPLVLAVKLWAKHHRINEAKNQTLSSYTLTLMVIHYLQSGTSPQVLPCLHQLYPDTFFFSSDIFCLSYLDSPRFRSENQDSAGSLLVGFFKYYSSETLFNTRRDVASVRTGRILDGEDCQEFARREKLGPGQWTAYLLVEEPFDRTNAARAVCSADKWRLIQSVFKSTCSYLESTKISTLIFQDLLN